MKFNIVGLGEVLWDLLPGGRQMGGAPANFTCHTRALGAEACLISRVGNDGLGHEIIARRCPQRAIAIALPTAP
jgi:fructokinase